MDWSSFLIGFVTFPILTTVLFLLMISGLSHGVNGTYKFWGRK